MSDTSNVAGKVEALRKITVKEVMKKKPTKIAVLVDGTDVQAKDADGNLKWTVNAVDLMLIIGRARDHRIGSTQFGDFVEYLGSFEGRRIEDGAVFQSTRLILPPPASDIMFNDYREAKAGDQDAMVDFAIIIGLEPSERGTEGYRFTCKPIADPEQSKTDPLADLRRMLVEQVPELADKLKITATPREALSAPVSGEAGSDEARTSEEAVLQSEAEVQTKGRKASASA